MEQSSYGEVCSVREHARTGLTMASRWTAISMTWINADYADAK
ncbi:hypothetical protein SP41_104 [Salmonella phage 41]|nr:hypothetical protein SP41_104 [Salmonella phage 41]